MSTLDVVLFLPLIGFLLMLFTPKENPNISRWTALAISILVFVVSLGLLAPYWFAYPTGYTFQTYKPWINFPPIHYHVGLDGLSLWLVLLSTFLTPIAVAISWKYIDHRVKEYFAFLILLEFGLIGVFVSIDLFLFYVFWEISLVPMYFLIGIWGHDRRIYATVKFFLYTFAGSVLRFVKGKTTIEGGPPARRVLKNRQAPADPPAKRSAAANATHLYRHGLAATAGAASAEASGGTISTSIAWPVTR